MNGLLQLFCVLIVNLVITVVSAESVVLPANIPRCKPGPENCLAKTFTEIFKSFKDFRNINVPELNPYVSTKAVVFRTRNQNGPITINIRNINTTVYGLQNLEVTETRGWEEDPHKSKYEMNVYMPLIHSVAHYKTTMKFFNVPLHGRGVNNSTIRGANAKMQIIANVVSRNGADYLDVQHVQTDIVLKKLSFDIHDKLNDNVVIQAVNQVLNENWQDIFHEMKPDFERSIADTFKEIVKPMFDGIPYKSIFLE